MYCKNCGNQMDEGGSVCVHCGYERGDGNQYCPNCGTKLDASATFCSGCGIPLTPEAASNSSVAKSRLAAGLLGIFVGGFGVHNFYLGFTGKGVAQLLLTVFCCGIGWIWGFIEGIMILAGAINMDFNGVPLKD